MAGLYVDMKIMGYNLSCPKGVKVSKIKIRGKHGQISILIARKEGITEPATGVLWIHGGGYATGFKEMLYMGNDGLFHAFDMNKPDLAISKEAIERFNERFAYAKEHYFVEQEMKDVLRT